MSNLDFGHLAKYGLDRFTATIKLVDGAIQVTTAPHSDSHVTQQLQAMMPEALMDGVTETNVFITNDGFVSATQIRPDRRGEIFTILKPSRDAMFARLEQMSFRSDLRKIAHQTAHEMIMFGKNHHPAKVVCRGDSDGSPLDTFITMLLGSSRSINHDGESLAVTIPGADGWLPTDFQADFNREQVALFNDMVHEEIPVVIEEAENLLRKIPANIDKAKRFLGND